MTVEQLIKVLKKHNKNWAVKLEFIGKEGKTTASISDVFEAKVTLKKSWIIIEAWVA